MKGDRGRELAALGVKVVRAFGVVELPALGLDSSVKFCVLHCYMFYLFDATKVVIFLPFTKFFCNYFFIHHHFFLFTLLYNYIGFICAVVLDGVGLRLTGGTSTPQDRHALPPLAARPRGGGVGIYASHGLRGEGRHDTVWRSVSLPNQGFGVEFTDAIALIINYLGSPFGRAFAE